MEKPRKTRLGDIIEYSQCRFDSISTSFGDDYPFVDRYPLMKVWFRIPTEGKKVFWVPKWKEIYEVLHYAVQTETRNFPSSSWSLQLKALENVLGKEFRMPKRKHVGSSYRSGKPIKQLTEEEKKSLEGIRKYQSGEENEDEED